jgi:hypothetical protein
VVNMHNYSFLTEKITYGRQYFMIYFVYFISFHFLRVLDKLNKSEICNLFSGYNRVWKYGVWDKFISGL